jgi:hypothetical protein
LVEKGVVKEFGRNLCGMNLEGVFVFAGFAIFDDKNHVLSDEIDIVALVTERELFTALEFPEFL